MAAGVPVSSGSCLRDGSTHAGRKSKPVGWSARARGRGRQEEPSAGRVPAAAKIGASAVRAYRQRCLSRDDRRREGDQGRPEADGEGGESERPECARDHQQRQGRPWDERCQEPRSQRRTRADSSRRSSGAREAAGRCARASPGTSRRGSWCRPRQPRGRGHRSAERIRSGRPALPGEPGGKPCIAGAVPR